MKIEEIASRLATIKKSLQATDLHTLTLRVEEVEKLIEEYNSNLWTSPCICPPDEKTGETLCCNICGKPTARTSKGLPGDEALKARYGVAEGHIMGAQYMGSIASPLLASKDARIRELEEELRLERFQEDDSHLYDDEDDHFVQCDDCKQPDACRDFGCYKDELTPPKN